MRWMSLVVLTAITACASGSQEPRRTSDGVEAYYPVSDRWSRIHPMPFHLRSTRCVGVDGRIYVAGGLEKRQWLNGSSLFLRYDPARDSWDRLRRPGAADVHRR